MRAKYNILIIEPSVIIQKGISKLINSVDTDLNIYNIYSLNDSLEISIDEPFSVILVNPVIFNNSQKSLNKFYSHFQSNNFIGLLSTYYDRSFYSNFSDFIYLNDDVNTIENIITKHLTLKNSKKRNPSNALSERETEVLKLLVTGESNKKIAEKLFISIHTVVTHRKNLSNKLGVKSTAAMAIYAVANNIIDLNDSLKSIK